MKYLKIRYREEQLTGQELEGINEIKENEEYQV